MKQEPVRRYLQPIGIAFGAVLSFSLALISASAAESDSVLFRIGESAPANTYLAIWMAKEAGLYEAEGLSVESVHMAGGGQAAPQLEAGNIQLMHVGMSTVLRANASGSDLRIIGSLSNVIRFTFFGAPGIETVGDLRGGAVGISSTGSESDATTSLALARLGLTREDVRMVEVGRDRLPKLLGGEMAATMLGEPERTAAFAEDLHPFVDLYADRIPWLFSGLVVDATYLEAHRDELKHFLRATIEGNYLAISDPMRAREVLANELALTDADVISASFENFRNETPDNVEIDLVGAENVLDAFGAADAGGEIGDYIDTSLLDELQAEGFFEAMRARYGAP